MESINNNQTNSYQSSSSQERIRIPNKHFLIVAGTVATVVLAVMIGIPYLHSEVYAYFFGEGIVSSAIFWTGSAMNLATCVAGGFFFFGSAGEGSSRLMTILNPQIMTMLGELKTTQKEH